MASFSTQSAIVLDGDTSYRCVFNPGNRFGKLVFPDHPVIVQPSSIEMTTQPIDGFDSTAWMSFKTGVGRKADNAITGRWRLSASGDHPTSLFYGTDPVGPAGKGKALAALPLFLSMIDPLVAPDVERLNFRVVVLVHDIAGLKTRIVEAMTGEHSIILTNGQHVVVNIEVSGVRREGTGVRPSAPVLTWDWGGDTLILMRWNGGTSPEKTPDVKPQLIAGCGSSGLVCHITAGVGDLPGLPSGSGADVVKGWLMAEGNKPNPKVKNCMIRYIAEVETHARRNYAAIFQGVTVHHAFGGLCENRNFSAALRSHFGKDLTVATQPQIADIVGMGEQFFAAVPA